MQDFQLSVHNLQTEQAEVISDHLLVETKLHQLHSDLTPTLLREIITAGLNARNETTQASAPTAAGVQQWHKTVQELRSRLAANKWKIHDQRNCPFITAPDRGITIAVMTGDSETGKFGSNSEPTNQAEKGAVAAGYVESNNQQLELFNSTAFNMIKQNQTGTQVWVLLYHYDRDINCVRYELSLPTQFHKKKITGWGLRIILSNISNNPEDIAILDNDSSPQIFVDVEPKLGAI